MPLDALPGLALPPAVTEAAAEAAAPPPPSPRLDPVAGLAAQLDNAERNARAAAALEAFVGETQVVEG